MAANPNTRALLERARNLCEPPTWYQLAKRTGIRETTLSRCIQHNRTLGDQNAFRLAKFLRIDAKEVVGYMAEDRASTDEERGFWTAQLPRLLPSFAITCSFAIA